MSLIDPRAIIDPSAKLAEGKIEYVARAGGEMEKIAQDGALDFIRARLAQ